MRQFQRARTTEAQPQPTRPANPDAGVKFVNGTMQVHNQEQVPERVIYRESSNGLTMYTTIEWRDPVTNERRASCNCPGWTNKKGDKHRDCKHCKELMAEANLNENQPNATIRQERALPVAEFRGRNLRSIEL